MSCVSSIAKIERFGKLTDLVHPIIFIVRSSGRGPGRRLAYLLDACTKKQSHAL